MPKEVKIIVDEPRITGGGDGLLAILMGCIIGSVAFIIYLIMLKHIHAG